MFKSLSKFMFGTQLPQALVDGFKENAAKEGVFLKAGFFDEITEAMHRAGVDMNSSTSITDYIKGNMGYITELTQKHGLELPAAPEGVKGPLYDELVEHLRQSRSTSDAFLWAALQVFGGKSARHAVYADTVASAFRDDKGQFGFYMRKVLSLPKRELSIRGAALITSDAVRVSGDAMEAVVIAMAKATNKYAFQATANGIDKVAKRPEELKGVNVFNRKPVGDTSIELYERNSQ